MLSVEDPELAQLTLTPFHLSPEIDYQLLSKIPLTGPLGLHIPNRARWRTYIRNTLENSYCSAANQTVKIPWRHHFRSVIRDGVLLVGYPLTCPLEDPSGFSMPDLWTLICAIDAGICYFRRVEEEERDLIIKAWELGVKQGIYKPIPKHKKRSDADDYRGRRLNPETTRKKKGGWVHSDAMVPDGWDQNN